MSEVIAECGRPIVIWTGKVDLKGSLYLPDDPVALIIRFVAPGSQGVAPDIEMARAFGERHLGMLSVTVLTELEVEADRLNHRYAHDADFMAQRIIDVAQWTRTNEVLSPLPIGYCGYSTTAAGALVAAALRPDLVSAVVAVNGRTDLAIDHLRNLKTPTLLSVNDMPVLRMNREALATMRCEKRIEIVHGTDPGAIAAMVAKSVQWYLDKLALVAA